MQSLNRRQLIAGAGALLGQANLPFVFAREAWPGAGSNTPQSVNAPPKDLLSLTFTPAVLSKFLLSPSTWHPYPRVDEREAWQSVPQDISGAILLRAEVARGTEWASLPATSFLEFKRNGNRSRFEHPYSARRQRLIDLTLGECLEGKGRFLDEIANGIWLICEETFWGYPAHLYMQKSGPGLPDVAEPVLDLGAAETAATLSWVDYLVGARLHEISPLIQPRIRVEAMRRILDPALDRNDFWWMGLNGTGGLLNNWNPFINSKWMVTNLLLEQDPTRRLAAVSKICRSLDRYLADYSSDGGCEEGPGYWGMSAASYFECCATLASATGGAANVLDNPFIGKMGHYIADVHIADLYYVNYGDAHAKGGSAPELAYRFGSGVGDKVLGAFGAFYATREGVNADGSGPIARAIPDILGAATLRSAPRADVLERDSWYPALGLMTARARARTTEGFYMAVQAAKNHRSHGHNDSGSFIVFHDGEPVFIDVGTEAYTAKTFSAERYSIWTMQSAYHNLPTVGSVMQQEGEDNFASDVHYASDDAHAGLSMNLATAYPAEAGIRRWFRDIRLERNAGLIWLTEDFQLQRKMAIALSFMTPRVPSQGSTGNILLSPAHKSGRGVSLKYDASLVVPSFEKIVLQDDGLRQSWGEVIYRVFLTSTAPTDSGKWIMEIS